MQSKPSRWRSDPYEVAAGRAVAEGLGVSPVVGAILARRGLGDLDEARRFLAAEEAHDPRTLPGVPAACELILRHVEHGSAIAVFGDYDVDGVCSTAMLIRTLRSLGADPVWELPSRFDEGYGLSTAAAERLAGRGVTLLITVDCGITAVEPVAAARAAGLDVVVTDHHRPGAELPDCTVVHPALGDYGCPELCASGVVLKLSEGLLEAAGRDPAGAAEDADLAALATVCDLVPLRGENRRIVREGLVALGRTQKPGLRALMELGGVAPGELTEHALGFRLGPRINAAGRMQRADAALELLLTEDPARASEVARELDFLNRDRQEAETRILFAAEAAAAAQAHAAAIVVAGEGWHPGVVGIVASRLVERWRRPCVVIALDAAGGPSQSGRGSGRSISAYDLHAGLAACSEHLTRFGGHRMAAGVELDTEALEPFRRALADHAAAALSPEDLIPVERVDAVVPGGDLGLGLAEDLELLRPFGMGNPQPTLLVPAARFERVTAMGEEREHSRFTLVTAGGARSRGVAFGSPPRALAPAAEQPHDIALRLERNRWKGVVEPRVILRALCPTEPGELEVLGEERAFWDELHATISAPAGELASLPGCVVEDRRREGFAGVAGDLFSSGERVLVAVADVPRRRASLEAVVAGLTREPMCVVSWAALAARPELALGFGQLVALDPPPGGVSDPLLGATARSHLAWGPVEAEFAMGAYRAVLDLRPQLAELYRALRELPPEAGTAAVEAALAGSGRYPRTAAVCGRLLRVLTELGLVELDLDARSCRVVEAVRTELESSPSYRAAREELAATERALAPELPRELPAAAAS
ncbi:MAG: single-stranded-DNA-specific exonuclease [Thermoleophilaceae bacterium]|nr:single-stranded-DNA-specific exonuclease [Thermoleophilaceae bacterium]